ncbi:hypothetical protein CMO93_01305 [Candidatus Woesearchaeota archaeon]|nr:hypothetical protein [Candidatus Woesearchaeota archaeon]|tara:strand:- start:1060 stop:1290 length:231 start_codon:yes stop_codon:yes gene_type:complete
MKGKLNLYYDEEGDFLEFHIGDFTEGYFRNLGKGIFERVDRKTNKVSGVAIMGFKKRTEGPKDVSVPLPMDIQLSS